MTARRDEFRDWASNPPRYTSIAGKKKKEYALGSLSKDGEDNGPTNDPTFNDWTSNGHDFWMRIGERRVSEQV